MNNFQDFTRRHALAVFPAAFTLAALLVQRHVGAYASDRGQTADEAAHFVTALMLSDYLHHFGNPVAFAKTYYVHLPRVAIGHWPPFFEVLQSLAFDLFGGTAAVALALQALIYGLMAGLPAALMTRQSGLLAGVLTGLIIATGRVALFQVDTVMADSLLGLLVFLSAWMWSRFYRRPSPALAAAAAASFAAAILTKGTALGLLLLPLAYVGLKRDWGFLFRRWSLIALAAVLALTVPWYVLTYRMAASGWNYSWGGFTLVALPFFVRALFTDFGVFCLIGFGYGALQAMRSRADGSLDMLAFAATAVVQFLFLLLVPADLQPRYLVPVYPCAAMVAVWGLLGLLDRYLPAGARRVAVAGALASVMVLLSIAQGFAPPHAESLRTREAFAQIGQTKNPLILVSGGARFEGAMIASVAEADRGRFFYVLRASKLLSSSSFMGGGYARRFSSAGEMKTWLIENRIGWIVIDTSPNSMSWGHNAMLLALAEGDPGTFHPVWKSQRPDGAVLLFRTPDAATVPTDMTALLAEQAPSGVP